MSGLVLTPVADLMVAQRQWEVDALAALAEAGLDASATEVDVWDALEAAGLNRGALRPEPRRAPALRARQPRRYRPAAYWRERLERVTRELEQIDAQQDADAPDRAAVHAGTSRDRARTAALARRSGARLERYATLVRRRDALAAMLARAERREAER